METQSGSVQTSNLPRPVSLLGLSLDTSTSKQPEELRIPTKFSCVHVSAFETVSTRAFARLMSFSPDWVDEISLRAFMQSAGYEKYLQTLSLGDTKETHSSHGPATTVAEFNRQSLPLWDIATIFTAAFIPSTEPDTSKLACLELLVPYSVYDPPRRWSPLRPASGWILDPQAEDGRPVKKGMVVQTWAPLEPFEKQLKIYRAVKQDAESREAWRLQLEELRVVSVEEMTWDFGDSNESDESASELDDEANLVEKVGDIKV
ncbi:hypothetical protein diail_11124 [Diaporthe ilicicola]|nr:hypothetical protein diail_11124 [Diaporthe ilicicola]